MMTCSSLGGGCVERSEEKVKTAIISQPCSLYTPASWRLYFPMLRYAMQVTHPREFDPMSQTKKEDSVGASKRAVKAL